MDHTVAIYEIIGNRMLYFRIPLSISELTTLSEKSIGQKLSAFEGEDAVIVESTTLLRYFADKRVTSWTPELSSQLINEVTAIEIEEWVDETGEPSVAPYFFIFVKQGATRDTKLKSIMTSFKLSAPRKTRTQKPGVVSLRYFRR